MSDGKEGTEGYHGNSTDGYPGTGSAPEAESSTDGHHHSGSTPTGDGEPPAETTATTTPE
jgi:hypothetical protein